MEFADIGVQHPSVASYLIASGDHGALAELLAEHVEHIRHKMPGAFLVALWPKVGSQLVATEARLPCTRDKREKRDSSWLSESVADRTIRTDEHGTAEQPKFEHVASKNDPRSA